MLVESEQGGEEQTSFSADELPITDTPADIRRHFHKVTVSDFLPEQTHINSQRVTQKKESHLPALNDALQNEKHSQLNIIRKSYISIALSRKVISVFYPRQLFVFILCHYCQDLR